MSDNKVITIVPALPPQVNGLGDYAFYLAKRLKRENGIDTIFLRTENYLIQNGQKDFDEECLSKKSRSSFLAFLKNNKPQCIILNYVGYAYSPRGCPFWLIEGISHWKKDNPSCKIITIFHELYASGKFLQSAFWLHYIQKNLAFRLYRLSDYSITTGEITFNILKSIEKKELHLMPVFSNIGELAKVVGYNKRENVFVVFGSAGKRNEIFSNSLSDLNEWCRRCDVTKIIEIGPLRDEVGNDNNWQGLEFIQRGVLSAVEISKILSQSKYGLIEYPRALLSKSGIFAAYSSHGVVPVVLGIHSMHYECDGLESGTHYLFDKDSVVDHSLVSENVFQWYQDHNLACLSSLVADIIGKG